MAGFLRGEPVELVKGVTVGVEVPARAEIVLEGYIEKDEVGEEGPFGDHTGYYTAAEPFPVFHVTAMTMRRDAIYPSIVVGKPPQEDAWLGKATERIFLPAIRTTLPEIVDYDLPIAGVFHNCCIVSIRKQFPGHAAKVMHALWGLGMLSLTKCVVVVDADVDVHDYEQVLFYAGANVDPKRDVILSEGPLDHLDHAPERQFFGGKLGIDATAKWPEEGARPWPEEIEMSPEIKRARHAPLDRVRAGLVLPPQRPADAIRLRSWWSPSSRVPTPSTSRSPRRRICRRRRCSRSASRSASSSLLVGLIIDPLLISSIGAAIAIVFAILWAREATAELRGRAGRRRAGAARDDGAGRRRAGAAPSTVRGDRRDAQRLPRGRDPRPRRR